MRVHKMLTGRCEKHERLPESCKVGLCAHLLSTDVKMKYCKRLYASKSVLLFTLPVSAKVGSF